MHKHTHKHAHKHMHTGMRSPKSERMKTIEAADAIISKLVADAKFPVHQGLDNLEIRAGAVQGEAAQVMPVCFQPHMYVNKYACVCSCACLCVYVYIYIYGNDTHTTFHTNACMNT